MSEIHGLDIKHGFWFSTAFFFAQCSSFMNCPANELKLDRLSDGEGGKVQIRIRVEE